MQDTIETPVEVQANFKTPLEEVLFRSSKVGLLAGGLLRNELTDKQKDEVDELQTLKESFVGLTPKQQETLDKLDKRVAEGETLSEKLEAQRQDFRSRLTTKKGLTEKQQERLDYLLEKDQAEPELSQGAKTYIKDVWLWFEKGFKEEISSKQTKKGKQAEEDGINLISFVDGVPYGNNNNKPDGGRVTKGNLTGACDVNTYFDVVEKRVIDDIKASWNPKTFMSTNYSTLEEWQGRAYMYLYDADIFRLRRVLVDCPPDVYADEYKKFCFDKGIIDDSLEEYQPLIEQFNRNFLYENSGRYTKEERVKTFAFYRDEELEKVLLKSIELALDYYQTITLNMID